MKRNSPTHKKLIALIVTTAALTVAAVGGVPFASSATTVKAGSAGKNIFSPATVTVSKGSRVTWKFSGYHNVQGKGWSSPFKSSGTWSRVFRSTGSFSYRCIIHPGMNGKVIVR